MPRKKAPAGPGDDPARSKRKTAPIQVNAEITHMVSVICAHDKITQAELLDEFIRPFVEKHYRRVQLEIAERVKKLDGG